MKTILQKQNTYIFRFDKNDEVVSLLRDFCEKNNIKAGFFWGIGACQEVVLSYYDLKSKKYIDKVFNQDLEITGFRGNVATLQTNVILHAHGNFSDKSMNTYSGHVKKLIISVTCEVVFKTLPGKCVRKYDYGTGLNLLSET